MSYQLSADPPLYEALEILKESPSHIVYFAWRVDQDFKTPVVIKLFKKKESPEALLQMESLLRAREGKHLVKVLSFERQSRRPALILEYIPALPLKQLTKNFNLLPGEAHYICAETLKGLKELKEVALSHGDLSLSNILIDIDCRVYLTDYGLANYEKALYGTAPFTAPELFQGGRVCFASDLFSLGVLEKLLKGAKSSLKSESFILKGDALLDPLSDRRREKAFAFHPADILSLKSKMQKLFALNTRFQKARSVPNPQKKLFFKNSKRSLLPDFEKTLPKNLRKAKKTLLPKAKGLYHLASTGGVFLFFLLTANPFISYGRHFSAKKFEPSKIQIRTREWIHIQVAGFKGYGPADIQVLRPGLYKLKWKNQRGEGWKYLDLKSGGKMALKDKDFP